MKADSCFHHFRSADRFQATAYAQFLTLQHGLKGSDTTTVSNFHCHYGIQVRAE